MEENAMNLEEFDKIIAGATDGPWTKEEHSWEATSIYSNASCLCTCNIHPDVTEETQDEYESQMNADAAFIAAARTTLPALLARYREMREFMELMTIGHPDAYRVLREQMDKCAEFEKEYLSD